MCVCVCRWQFVYLDVIKVENSFSKYRLTVCFSSCKHVPFFSSVSWKRRKRKCMEQLAYRSHIHNEFLSHFLLSFHFSFEKICDYKSQIDFDGTSLDVYQCWINWKTIDTCESRLFGRRKLVLDWNDLKN